MIIDEMKIRDERQFKALTGVSPEEFQRLLPVFTTSYKEMVQEQRGPPRHTSTSTRRGAKRQTAEHATQALFYSVLLESLPNL